jgi:hypothetical protein
MRMSWATASPSSSSWPRTGEARRAEETSVQENGKVLEKAVLELTVGFTETYNVYKQVMREQG